MKPISKVSVVVPVYKGRSSLPQLITRIKKVFDSLEYSLELILVDDFCPQDSWDIIAKAADENYEIKGVKLSKNFGQQQAINAGLSKVTGAWIIVMDCDLQDSPEEIPNLLKKTTKEFEIILAKRKKRKDSFLKKTISFVFYRVFSLMIGVRYDGTVGNFGAYSKRVVDIYNRLEERNKVFSPMIRTFGFKSDYLVVQHANRAHGKSSYTWRKLFSLALNMILSYSDRPLRYTIYLGFFISGASLVFILYNLILYFQGFIEVAGYTSIIASISFFSGLIIFVIGVIGLYLSKVLENVKSRPDYYIEEEVNFS